MIKEGGEGFINGCEECHCLGILYTQVCKVVGQNDRACCHTRNILSRYLTMYGPCLTDPCALCTVV